MIKRGTLVGTQSTPAQQQSIHPSKLHADIVQGAPPVGPQNKFQKTLYRTKLETNNRRKTGKSIHI